MLSSSWYLLFWTAQNISFVRLQMSLQIGRIPQGSTCSSPWKIHTRQLKVHTCRSTKATEGKMHPTKCLSSNNKYFLTVCWYICHTLKMPSLTAITIHGILDSTWRFQMPVSSNATWLPLPDPTFLNAVENFTPMHKSTEAWIDLLFPPQWTCLPECKPGNNSFHRHCRCGWFEAGAPIPLGEQMLPLIHFASMWVSLHLWQLTVKNCEQLQSKKHRVKSQSRCKARYCINPENWQMESIWFKLQQIYLSKRKKQEEETGSSSLSAPCTIHSDCSLMPYALPLTLEKAGRSL